MYNTKGENLIASDSEIHKLSIFIHSSTVYKHSVKTQNYILVNVSTLEGDYTIMHTVNPAPLLSLVFNDSPTYHESIVSNKHINHV